MTFSENIDHDEIFTIATLNTMNSHFDSQEAGLRIGQGLKNLDLDAVFLQEITYDPFSSEPESDILDAIVDSSGLPVISVAVSDLERTKIVRGETRRFNEGLAILSKHPFVEHGDFSTTGYGANAYAVIQVNDRYVGLINIHGAWGGNRTSAREIQAVEIDDFSERLAERYPGIIILLAGDFNATRTSSPLKFLTGEQSIHGRDAFWIDTWEHTNPNDPGYTSNPLEKHNAETAHNIGITHPSHMPARRIDFALVRGWAYGQPGSPLWSELCFTEHDTEGYTVSDHYGIHAGYWVPRP